MVSFKHCILCCWKVFKHQRRTSARRSPLISVRIFSRDSVWSSWGSPASSTKTSWCRRSISSWRMEHTSMCANEPATVWEPSRLFYLKSSWRRWANYCWIRFRRERIRLTKWSMFSVSHSWPNQSATNWRHSSTRWSPYWASWCRRSRRTSPTTWIMSFQRLVSPLCNQSSTSALAS